MINNINLLIEKYINESQKYDYRVVKNSHSNGYYDKTIYFKVPDRWGEFDTTNKEAGIHISLAEYEYKDDGKYWNFGYSLIAETKQGKTTVSNGKDAKRYYPLDNQREYIKDMLYELTEEFIKEHKFQVSVIIRGPLNDFKVELDRYKHITDIIKSCGYDNIENIKVAGNNFIIQSKDIISDTELMIPDIKKRWKL